MFFLRGVPASAESNAAQKALEGIKESVDTLVNAKDENNPNEMAFRVEALKKVIDFSEVETKELKVKLFSSFEEPHASGTIEMWQDSVISRLNDALTRYETEKKSIEDIGENATKDDIKQKAEGLKAWRDETYMPLANEVNDFLMVHKQKKSIETANARLEKIRGDVSKLEKAFSVKKVEPLASKLNQANEILSEASALAEEASSAFKNNYLLVFENNNENNSSSTQAGDEINTEAKENNQNSTTTITDSEEVAASLDAPQNVSSSTEAEIKLQPSIKDLVRESLAKVKEAYQIFIEMSGFVRKLF
ncbi:hypothetical protein A3I34_01765 [Candidatus Jorgensenbacteria bacterium RIFCSPLOWO2_02_FULL_45_12]|nr:MAG: hypothetical protein A3D55_02170 [Candidatus Jorgensenbacteria bacterium RIFCSPHIGHO2_02_FULL_45_20]OGG42323.1 MAG: hypothetical protein A3I34_01765 [Candidatus Jorgensenbacteria bacterium RIFCSPLOWO2_02_FULL_45_12]